MGAPLWLRFGVGGLSQVSPGRASALTHRFFRRPGLSSGYCADDMRRLAKAEAVLAEAEQRQTVFGELGLHSYHFRPSGAARGAVLLLHGWSGDSRAMAAFPQPLLEAGYEVAMLDFPAHGRSDGIETDVVDAAAAARAFLDAHDIRPDHIIAHSFGGAVASLLAEGGVQPRTFTSIAAPTDFALVLAELTRLFNLSRRAESFFVQDVARSLNRDPMRLNAGEIWRGAPTEILVLHALADSRVSFDHARLLAALDNVELVVAEGVDHCAIVYAPETVAAALGHIGRADPAVRTHRARRSEVA